MSPHFFINFKQCFLWFAFCLGLAGSSFGGSPSEYLRWHNQCLKEDDASKIDTYIKKYQAAVAANPKDQLAKAYLGSAYTLRSAASGWGRKKLDYMKKGGRLMDEAAGADFQNPRVRFLRAANGYKVPKMFKRRPVAVEDFTFLLPIAIAGNGDLSKRERQAMLYYAWKTFHEEGHPKKAKQAREHCHRINPSSWYGKQTG